MREEEKSSFIPFDFDTNFVEFTDMIAAGIHIILEITVIY